MDGNVVYDKMLNRQEGTFHDEISKSLLEGMKEMPVIHYIHSGNVDIYKQRCEDILNQTTKTKTSKEIAENEEYDDVFYLYLNIIQHYNTYINKEIKKEKINIKDEILDLEINEINY